VVTSTGFGDGSYPLEVSKDADGKIVAVRIVYISNEEEDEGDVCGVCGEEIEYGETCDCIDE
jgi:CRISPR/Cas system-associated protein Cas10 (large subunit of type III CRISPR-Cas system)